MNYLLPVRFYEEILTKKGSDVNDKFFCPHRKEKA